jgi:hypothetical protein
MHGTTMDAGDVAVTSGEHEVDRGESAEGAAGAEGV